jgi:nucleotide-binding universal stress UspA family protein
MARAAGRARMSAMKAILLATDGSTEADAALVFACRLARDAGAVLHVLCVRLPGPSPLDAAEIAMTAARRARAANVQAYAYWADGPEAETIEQEARRLRVGLVVIGARDPERDGRPGDISRTLLQGAGVPVTVVQAVRPGLSAAA